MIRSQTKAMQNPTFLALLQQMAEVHDRKNQDYASVNDPYSNFTFAGMLSEQFSHPTDRAFAVLMGVKLARLGQLLGQGKTAQNESVDDTLLDLTNYAAIWTAWRRDQA